MVTGDWSEAEYERLNLYRMLYLNKKDKYFVSDLSKIEPIQNVVFKSSSLELSSWRYNN